ncbi:uncharacterized protein MELLADRAFT_101068 [Melampsora larici-populina 98AG31]|uniref:Uncharacterized protein n=1 Tax=Melampsora larici-populina (strain 98AG31 / pathotype 3-4-7) TaxID=747676 RepID=F4R3I5_MELLP|nr:uncharacterized protein MELLADRAFT_101068 [Melampsora larici-populina 98AG31]EGG12634.1 hypothetical protein MELLADRAFT_101068 [Melampsora larici-populina 98AG31]
MRATSLWGPPDVKPFPGALERSLSQQRASDKPVTHELDIDPNENSDGGIKLAGWKSTVHQSSVRAEAIHGRERSNSNVNSSSLPSNPASCDWSALRILRQSRRGQRNRTRTILAVVLLSNVATGSVIVYRNHSAATTLSDGSLPQAFSTPTPEPQFRSVDLIQRTPFFSPGGEIGGLQGANLYSNSPLVGGINPGLGLPLGAGIGPVGALGGGIGSPLGLTGSPAFANNQYGLPINRNNFESSGFNRGGNGFSNGYFGAGSGFQSRRSQASLLIAGLGVFNLMVLLV